MLNVGILVSGGGSNLQAIIDKVESGYIKNVKIVTVVSSRPDAYALERAKQHGIKGICISRKTFNNIEEYDEALISHFKAFEVDLVVMAGFLSILGERFTRAYEGRVINIHPALIPSFCGKGFYGIIPHQKVLETGVKVTGATVHFVELEADAGPIILQKAVYVQEDDTPEILQKRVMEQAEWEILPEAVRLFAENRLVVEGRRVKII
ncbi:phosphoribosylglycinamide formyltransferase [Ruminiclostridium papyrosolvens DSM 2782]|uniref:Phosphoribosylglycinamide formyltransferase n=1 Tax=Ruminiclostridium papyrosolvens DSM 2782 TaxID=588581 RepID=F1TH76_9FIRM|nr:phosphoribosylglycinamide formyltransferase [Ruminiclostridium papyrosolvens]EGD46316.1 phosphoribosylglycinamide formyltransferase [Ruminiclostridium papyrosolvens DSM 2782]WES32964.1 phosphoribosylglycinamide formyltransferase [Ruminiclostridium papyrosolvens DSM 2782]